MSLRTVCVLVVIALFISLNVVLTVLRLVLFLAAKAGFIAAIAMPIATMFRSTRAAARLSILQTVVRAILITVLGSHATIRLRAGSILANVSGRITAGVTSRLVALIVSSLIVAAVVRIIGLQAI